MADSLRDLVMTAMGGASGGKGVPNWKKRLDALPPEAKQELWDKAKLDIQVLMAGLVPLAVKVLRRLMLDFEKNGTYSKEAGAAAARVLDFAKSGTPMVVVQTNIGMRSESRLNLPPPREGLPEVLDVKVERPKTKILPEGRAGAFAGKLRGLEKPPEIREFSPPELPAHVRPEREPIPRPSPVAQFTE